MINHRPAAGERAKHYPLYDADCDNTKFGTGFGITGVSRISKDQYYIDKKTTNNGN